MDLVNEFFAERAQLYDVIVEFDKKHKQSLIKKLTSEKKKGDFLSLITEINFGLFFDQFCTKIEYDKKIGGQTPDWTLDVNGQTVLAEVMRLNASQSDQIRIEKMDEQIDQGNLHSSINPINYNYLRLSGENSAFLKKAKKYETLIRRNKLPYIICTYMHHESWFKKSDMTDFLANFHVLESSMEHPEPVYLSKDTVPKRLDCVSGVLLRINDMHTYYHNFSENNLLSEENQHVLTNQAMY
ncbi:hypothetical protein [Dyadobacter arcticus]|uniref:Ribosomal protein L36 n=1 Tax=Dyadobacter arcticus TaxID=1078754 RepID=A0ABX0UFD0_9BACT|nr:hypothetical protein [Dyadobacter arcticus]NIJ51709.1 ribosomal protein L36 [Dyadobacter arcticus]